MPAVPIPELVMDDMVSALGGMSLANGDHFDYPGGVKRFEILGTDHTSFPVVSVFPVGFEITEETEPLSPGQLFVSVEVWDIHDTSAFTSSTEEKMLRHFADIFKALRADTTRGSNAINTRITAATIEKRDEGQTWVVLSVNVVVDYRTNFKDMGAAS